MDRIPVCRKPVNMSEGNVLFAISRRPIYRPKRMSTQRVVIESIDKIDSFGLVVFDGISTLIGYLMPISVLSLSLSLSLSHTHTYYTYDLKANNLLVTLFLNELDLFCLHTVKWFLSIAI